MGMSQRGALSPKEAPMLGSVPKRCQCEMGPIAPVGPPCSTNVPACLPSTLAIMLPMSLIVPYRYQRGSTSFSPEKVFTFTFPTMLENAPFAIIIGKL